MCCFVCNRLAEIHTVCPTLSKFGKNNLNVLDIPLLCITNF